MVCSERGITERQCSSAPLALALAIAGLSMCASHPGSAGIVRRATTLGSTPAASRSSVRAAAARSEDRNNLIVSWGITPGYFAFLWVVAVQAIQHTEVEPGVD